MASKPKLADAALAGPRLIAKPAEAPKARRYDATETRARVLEAAYMLFGTRGYSATGTADIAREADVSEGSIFYHFGSKRALLVELGRMHGERMVRAMQRDDSIETLRLADSLGRCFDFCDANFLWEGVIHDDPACAGPSMKDHKHNPEAEPFFNATREVVVEWTRKHMEAVQARYGKTEMDCAVAASMIFALVGDALHQYSDPANDDAARAAIRAECIRFCTAAAGHSALL